MTRNRLTPTELTALKRIVEQYRAHPELRFTEEGSAFYDPARDGVTYTLLSTFRRCRELARLGLHGLTDRRSSAALTFGHITHGALQVIYTNLRTGIIRTVPTTAYMHHTLMKTEQLWRRENARASADSLQYLEYAMTLAEATLPAYFRYWRDDFLTKQIQWLSLEEEFRLPLAVPVWWQDEPFKTFVRGKMDGNFLMLPKKELWLFETKTKAYVDEALISDILTVDLQVNLYAWAMHRLHGRRPRGVRYNLIRRPLLRQKKSEDLEQFARRCAQDVVNRPEWYFSRLDMTLDTQDMVRFEGELMALVADFLSWWYGAGPHYHNSDSCRNIWGPCPMLPICARRDYGQVFRRDTVFRELEET